MNLLKEVAEKVNRPFSEKYLETQGIVARHIAEFRDKVAVAFSGGKDSLVVLFLVYSLYPEIKVVFNNTGVEYSETVTFVTDLQRKWNLNLIITHPEKTFWDCTTEYGFPQGTKWGEGKPKVALGYKRNIASCCYWLKEKPMLLAIRENGWLGYFTGETAVESRLRMFAALKGTCLHLKKEGVCKIKPILWWTPDEVRQFILDMNIPNNPLYARGINRIGCMPCTAHKLWESQLQKFNPRMYEIIKLRKDSQYVMRLV